MNRPRHHPEFISVVHMLEPLLRRYRPLRLMDLDDLADWISWYWNRGTMSYFIDDNVPQGVCLVRLFRRLDQFMDRDTHDPCGRFCFIELSVARDGEVMGLMLEDLENRWGPQEIMVWDRGSKTENGTPRMYTWNKFKKLARRLSTYGITKNA